MTKEKFYTVWVGGSEVNDYEIDFEEAKRLKEHYLDLGYDDVEIEEIV